MTDNIIKDSGKKEIFKSGYNRDSRDGKGRFDLLPAFALEELAKHFEGGGKKYGDNNWKLGAPQSRIIDSLLRHINKVMKGENDEDHFRAIAWNAMVLLDQRERINKGMLSKELDDINSYLKIQKED